MISKPPIKHHRLFPNDIIKFECAKVSWIDKYITKTNNHYIYSYQNQGEIKHQYKLKNNDLFKVKSHILGTICLEPMTSKIPNDLYFTSSNNTNNMFVIVKEVEATKIVRKEKLNRLNEKR